MRAFATYVVGKATRVKTGLGWKHVVTTGALLDEDDDLPALLRRGRKLPGRLVFVRTADGVQMGHRLTAPTEALRVPEFVDDVESDEESVRAAG